MNSFEGLVFPHFALFAFLTFSALFTIIFCFISTLELVFPSLRGSPGLEQLRIYGIIWVLIEILINFIRVNHADGENIRKLKEIGVLYLKRKFWVDLGCLFSLLLNIVIEHDFALYFGVVFFCKLPDCSKKISKLETQAIDTFYKEQYWELIKLVFRNFLFAHIIALILILMSWIDSQENWMLTKDIADHQWYQQYAWSYYWATTIMLTVGFGDIAAANYQEAICLIFIEMISCMTLAYNINCVGRLISELRERSIEKRSSLKILRNMAEKNQIDGDLEFKLKNHIE